MRIYKVGDVIGVLTIREITVIDGHRTAIFDCECGNEIRRKTSLIRMDRKIKPSCGCLRRELLRGLIVAAREKRSEEGLEKIKLNIKKGRKTVDPTPEEIAQRSAEIRAEWPPERFAKYDSGRMPVEIRVCRGGTEVDMTERIM